VKLYYYKDTDSLYIDLSENTSVDSREVAPGVVADFDEEGKLVGFDIDRASQVADLRTVQTIRMPLKRKAIRKKAAAKPEIPKEVADVLKKVPAGYRVGYDEKGRPRMVKERAKPYGRKK
jgi:uncharacterized protein YuzE